MAVTSAKSFLKLLEKSSLVEPERLKPALAELSREFNGRVVTLADLTGHLIQQELLTPWQCEKLSSGRYKGFFLGKFKLLGHLGTGGMSSVYLAQHRVSGQFRAIKVLPRKRVADKSYLDRFYREGKAAAALNHPNIVRIYDICHEADTHYMVMEYVAGLDLYETVKRDGPLTPEQAAADLIQAAEGLAHAHKRNLVHRDIKPANLLRANDGTVKILDLGLALFQEQDEQSLTMLHGEKVMGTADYLAPEQAVDSHDIDFRADIYSLGCTLYYLMTGYPPFSTGTLAQRVIKHRTEYPPPMTDLRADCPPALVRICERMMRKNPAHRFQDCHELQAALKEFLETKKVTLPPEPDSDDLAGMRLPEPRSAPARSDDREEFRIETRSPSSKKLDGSSGRLVANPSGTIRKRELMPVWALVTMIVLGFAAVILAVLIARKVLLAESSATRPPVPRRPVVEHISSPDSLHALAAFEHPARIEARIDSTPHYLPG